MRKIAHISDLHFGAIDPLVLAALGKAIRATAPDVVVVSGDLTQRARDSEFRAARDFLRTLDYPQIVVPGNHDVPLYNLAQRAWQPFRRFQTYFGTGMTPVFTDAEIAIVGINTARAATFKDGRVNRGQVAEICRVLQHHSLGVTRIVVTHHPFEGPVAGLRAGSVGRAAMAMQGFSACGIDFILSGHLHTGTVGHTADHYDIDGYSALMIQAGTASSHRRRTQSNSFNMIHTMGNSATLFVWTWNASQAAFLLAEQAAFQKTAGQWHGDAPPPL